MKSFFKVPRPLLVATVFSIVVYLLIELVLVLIPEFFTGGEAIGNIVSSICLTFITGYCFYVIVNQIKNDKEKQHLKPFIKKRITNIMTSFGTMITELYEGSGLTMSIPPKTEEVKKLMEAIELTDRGPRINHGLSGKEFTWFELFRLNQSKTQKEINKLYSISSNLDSELISICAQIDDSTFYEWLTEMTILGREFNRFSTFSEHFHELITLNYRLSQYAYLNDLLEYTEEEKKNKKLLKKMYTIGLSKKEIDEELAKNQ